MDVVKKIDGNNWEVSLRGTMNYDDRERFRDVVFAFSQHGVKRITLDFANLDYMGSLGIGMLLVMHEDALNNDGIIVVKNLKGAVKTLFEFSALENIFAIPKG